MKVSDFDRTHGVRVYRGSVNPRRAAPMLPRISDGTNDVDNASEILFTGGVVTEPEDGVAQVTLGGGTGGGGGTSSATAISMFNNAGQDLNVGDVVVVDETADSAVTVTTTAGDIRIVGIVQEPIADGATGKVLFNGYASTVRAPDAVRGEYAQTDTSATVAASTAAREAGSFGVYLTGTDFPDFVTSFAVTTTDIPVESLVIDMPASVPVDRILFLQLQLDSAASSPDIPGWTLIGSTDPFYYYTRQTLGADFAVATWTTPSVAVATVLLLHEAVSLAVPLENFDYDSTTSAASLSGLSDVSRYAIAGVDADVATPGSGFVRLAGGTADYLAGGTPSLVQSAEGDKTGVTLGSAVTPGNLVVAVPIKSNATDTWSTDARQGGTCPVDVNMVQIARGVDTGATPGFVATGIMAKIAADTYAGPYGTDAACDASAGYLLLAEFENVGVNGYQVATEDAGSASTVDPNGGAFTVGADDVTYMTIAFRSDDNHDPIVSVNGFTQLFDGAGFALWWWVGYKIGDGDASVTLGDTTANQHWAAAAAVFTGGGSHAEGTLAGMYIGHDASVTSPFSGGSQQNDALFAFNLLQDAKPSVLLYGPDLGASDPFSGDAADVNLADAGGYFTATDVEAAIAELASKDIGYQAHGNMGSTETFSALIGNHSGTFNADCTFTFSGATSGVMAEMALELLEDGTGGWQPTWPGSVVWPGGTPPTHDDTLGTTTIYLFRSRDGGTTWYGFQAGGGGSSVAALDDLSDVTITTPVADQQLQYVGGVWVNNSRHWEPLMDGGSPYAPLDDGTGTDWLFVWVP